MVTTASKSYDWLKVLKPELVKLQDLSATGGPEKFSWAALSASLGKRFELPDLAITCAETKWYSEKELKSAFGNQAEALNFSLAALPGTATWAISRKDLAALMAVLLTKTAEPLVQTKTEFEDGFHRFIGLTLSHALSQLGFQGDYALNLLDDTNLPTGPALCLEIDIAACQTVIRGRVFATEELIKAWKERFSGAKNLTQIDLSLAKDVEALIHIEAGKVSLSHSEIAHLHPGDFVILDSCTVLPGEDKGRVMLTVHGVPVFRGMLKHDKIKVLEYPLYHKAETPMNKDTDADFEDEQTVDEEGETEGETASAKPGQTATMAERAGEIPVTINIEVGRITMKLDKLMQLQPGQLLELEVDPEAGVDLVVNGHCIGRGELLKLGEALGVRVLKLG